MLSVIIVFMKQLDLTKGPIARNMLLFAFPLICGNILQQLYNVVDTLIVGQYLGANALAAVGSAYSLMSFITSILLGLCMGSGAVFAIRFGERDEERLKEDMFSAFVFILVLALILNIGVFVFSDEILLLLNVPVEVYSLMADYLSFIYLGLLATFLYNYYACTLRAIGNSFIPLVFLGISAILNIVLDLVFILVFDMGVGGAAIATVIAQYFAAIALAIYSWRYYPLMRFKRGLRVKKESIIGVIKPSLITCSQQSVMNFGILMVQGLVNSFGAVIMAAFAAAVKIDSLAYMPLQDFGNAFSTFTGQNYGAVENERIKKGYKIALVLVAVFSLLISLLVFSFSAPLLSLFINEGESEVLAEGVRYLRVVAPFYIGIGILFLFYGFFRAIDRPAFSLVLTIISLGSRVALAYILSAFPSIGVVGIWWAIPIGWALADVVGFSYLHYGKSRFFRKAS